MKKANKYIFLNKLQLIRNQSHLLTQKQYFNPFSHKSDSFADNLTEYEEDDLKSNMVIPNTI